MCLLLTPMPPSNEVGACAPSAASLAVIHAGNVAPLPLPRPAILSISIDVTNQITQTRLNQLMKKERKKVARLWKAFAVSVRQYEFKRSQSNGMIEL